LSRRNQPNGGGPARPRHRGQAADAVRSPGREAASPALTLPIRRPGEPPRAVRCGDPSSRGAPAAPRESVPPRRSGPETLRRIPMGYLIRLLLFKALKGAAALVLGGTVLGLVVRLAGPRDSVAYIHVATPGVNLAVDEAEYRVEALWESPVVCTLSPGRH